jgi:hypothetical protein
MLVASVASLVVSFVRSDLDVILVVVWVLVLVLAVVLRYGQALFA